MHDKEFLKGSCGQETHERRAKDLMSSDPQKEESTLRQLEGGMSALQTLVIK